MIDVVGLKETVCMANILGFLVIEIQVKICVVNVAIIINSDIDTLILVKNGIRSIRSPYVIIR